MAKNPYVLNRRNVAIPDSPHGVDLDNEVIEGNLYGIESKIDGDLNMMDAQIGGSVSLNDSEIHGAAYLKGIKVETLYSENLKVEQTLTLENAEFKEADLECIEIGGSLNLSDICAESVSLIGAGIKYNLYLDKSNLEFLYLDDAAVGNLYLDGAKIEYVNYDELMCSSYSISDTTQIPDDFRQYLESNFERVK